MYINSTHKVFFYLATYSIFLGSFWLWGSFFQNYTTTTQRFYMFNFFSLWSFFMLFHMVDPISQDLKYHAFADQRKMCCVPNASNVLSNIPFLIIGLGGLIYNMLLVNYHSDSKYFIHQNLFLLGCILTCFGSSWYHLNPNNTTLVWDRLPMVICTSGVFLTVITQCIGMDVGLWNWFYVLGLVSVLYWNWQDDLRLYVYVQYYPILALPILFFMFPISHDIFYLKFAVYIYILARVVEFCDQSIYTLTFYLCSGHTLKHLLASISMYYCYFYFVSLKE